MKIRPLILTLAPAMALLAASCTQEIPGTRATIPLVERILAGEEPERSALLATHEKPQPSGAIVLLGNSESCSVFAEKLASYDRRDNVSGAEGADGLVDFAGERLHCISDDAAPSGLCDSLSQEEYRHRTVLKAIAAVDTLAHVSRFDQEGMVSKAAAKIIVMGDPRMSEYGYFDVDTLFRGTGCKVLLLSPLDLMLEELFGSHPGKALNVAIMADLSYADSLMYESVFARVADYMGAPASRCYVHSTQKPDMRSLRALLDTYMLKNDAQKLDALIVNDISLDTEALKTDLADMISVMNELSLEYSPYLSKNFSLIDGFTAVADRCYALLRSENLFTHDIAPLLTEHYSVADVEDGVVLIPNAYAGINQ